MNLRKLSSRIDTLIELAVRDWTDTSGNQRRDNIMNPQEWEEYQKKRGKPVLENAKSQAIGKLSGASQTTNFSLYDDSSSDNAVANVWNKLQGKKNKKPATAWTAQL